SSNKLSKVTGVVKDARTGRPVSGAKVLVKSQPDISTTSSASGTFTLSDVPKQSSVVVSARSYAAATVLPAKDMRSVRLTPIPATGRLLSSLNLAGVPGTVKTPAGSFAAKADGTFTMYGVLPGDAFTAAAPGYATVNAKVAPKTTNLVLAAAPATA